MRSLLVLVCTVLMSTAAFGQTRSRSTTKRNAPSTTSTVSASVAQARSSGATRVADQIKNLTRFVNLLGGVAKGIEQVDEAARKNEASSTALQQNEQNKSTVRRAGDLFPIDTGARRILFEACRLCFRSSDCRRTSRCRSFRSIGTDDVGCREPFDGCVVGDAIMERGLRCGRHSCVPAPACYRNGSVPTPIDNSALLS